MHFAVRSFRKETSLTRNMMNHCRAITIDLCSVYLLFILQDTLLIYEPPTSNVNKMSTSSSSVTSARSFLSSYLLYTSSMILFLYFLGSNLNVNRTFQSLMIVLRRPDLSILGTMFGNEPLQVNNQVDTLVDKCRL